MIAGTDCSDAIARAVRDAADDAGRPQGLPPGTHTDRRIFNSESIQCATCASAACRELTHAPLDAVLNVDGFLRMQLGLVLLDGAAAMNDRCGQQGIADGLEVRDRLLAGGTIDCRFRCRLRGACGFRLLQKEPARRLPLHHVRTHCRSPRRNHDTTRRIAPHLLPPLSAVESRYRA